jgi:predicted RNA-binding Zn-ribbon protein involved in translation (DUF1610 family)
MTKFIRNMTLVIQTLIMLIGLSIFLFLLNWISTYLGNPLNAFSLHPVYLFLIYFLGGILPGILLNWKNASITAQKVTHLCDVNQFKMSRYHVLLCPYCGAEIPKNSVDIKYEKKAATYSAICPNCGKLSIVSSVSFK